MADKDTDDSYCSYLDSKVPTGTPSGLDNPPEAPTGLEGEMATSSSEVPALNPGGSGESSEMQADPAQELAAVELAAKTSAMKQPPEERRWLDEVEILTAQKELYDSVSFTLMTLDLIPLSSVNYRLCGVT